MKKGALSTYAESRHDLEFLEGSGGCLNRTWGSMRVAHPFDGKSTFAKVSSKYLGFVCFSPPVAGHTSSLCFTKHSMIATKMWKHGLLHIIHLPGHRYDSPSQSSVYKNWLMRLPLHPHLDNILPCSVGIFGCTNCLYGVVPATAGRTTEVASQELPC